MAAYTFKGHDVEVLEIEGNLARISEQGIEFSVRTKQLKEKKEKLSPADRAVVFREEMGKPPLAPSSRTLEHFFLRQGAPEGVGVRLHTALFHDVIEDWATRGQVILPSGHRAINYGERGGEPMWGIAATLDYTSCPLPDDIKAGLDARGVNFNGDKINDLNFVRWLLLEGQSVGWKVTLTS